MNVLLIGINSKFIHSNLAIRYLQSYVHKNSDIKVDIEEFTINQQLDFILQQIYLKRPDILGFSCYIWNYDLITLLVIELKKLMPNTIIILGGPEVSFDGHDAIKKTNADIVITGEGEKTLLDLLTLVINNRDYTKLDGIVYKKDSITYETNNAKLIPLDDIPFVYNNLDDLQNKLVYYEASRGCPFSCQYCLSGQNGSVRLLSLERVFSDLMFFIKSNIKQVKFVDRTFNANKDYAMKIMLFIKENDNMVTNFHFEIAAELLDNDTLIFLQSVRKGLFQFEIGVQSTNEKTLKAIKRITIPQKLTPIVNSLQKNQNIHLHLDLIVGLPYEGYSEFQNSFNYVYSLYPDQFQIGFLKLLKGSGLYNVKSDYNILYTDFPPYEVLSTEWLSFDEIITLKSIEEMVEIFYNSKRYCQSINYLSNIYINGFELFHALSSFYKSKNHHIVPLSKNSLYKFLLEFFLSLNTNDDNTFKSLLLFDWYKHEKVPSNCDFLVTQKSTLLKNKVYQFFDKKDNIKKYLKDYVDFDTKQIIRNAHIELFPINPLTLKKENTAILFNYKERDIFGLATHFIINLD